MCSFSVIQPPLLLYTKDYMIFLLQLKSVQKHDRLAATSLGTLMTTFISCHMFLGPGWKTSSQGQASVTATEPQSSLRNGNFWFPAQTSGAGILMENIQCHSSYCGWTWVLADFSSSASSSSL